MPGHRRPEIRFSDAPRGQCRWCGEPILYQTQGKLGQIDRRRRWHPQCLDAYNLSDPSEARRRIRRRDRGRCGACGLHTYALRRELRKIGRGRTKEIRKRGFKPRQSFWELDHIVPLIDGGSHGDENLQTLCTPCHARKTALEARERAVRKRQEPSTADAPIKATVAQPETPPPLPNPTHAPVGRQSGLEWDELLASADAVNDRVRRALKTGASGPTA